ncbi:hypothetical protein EJ05DRAFT_508990 [Pseudovirgaria hyperparasitica]|uniref:Apple domain-containing protein n=1 Tax=Pseudovirgaria hyperparasitica TaxID=470096 RepID=A0A6A6WE75_9PEZI|nr:uncharacterized protein EJ05DRAFT_508990 [Pseudovirgaria hyperparasitica]KAF2760459.1 hypothetical protein EJ05DRAFT_508990 [Pseudovirgaria hyperparasitica]
MMFFSIPLIAAFAATTLAAPTQDLEQRTIFGCNWFSTWAAKCSTKGNQKSSSYSMALPYYTTTDRSLVAGAPCGNLCRQDWQCNSYAVGQGSCRLYRLSSPLIYTASNSGSLSFSDKCCVLNDQPAPVPQPSPSTTPSPSAVPISTATPTPSGLAPSSSSSLSNPILTPSPTPSPSETPAPIVTPSPSPSPSPSTTDSPVVPSSSASDTPAPQPTAPATCGTTGYDKQTPAAFLNDTSGNSGTVDTCRALCAKTATCQSFAVGNNQCLLYAAPVAGNLNPANSPYAFYDLNGC